MPAPASEMSSAIAPRSSSNLRETASPPRPPFSAPVPPGEQPRPAAPSPLGARQGKRFRARARIEAAQRLRPTLQPDRMSPVVEILRAYREQQAKTNDEPSPLARYLPVLRDEVEALEAWAASESPAALEGGQAIRRALGFLRTFGRIMSLDFSEVPIEEREQLVAVLALEHRWCYAAARTTRDAFKIAIGRTGAR